jgi:hypothetical protein
MWSRLPWRLTAIRLLDRSERLDLQQQVRVGQLRRAQQPRGSA